MFILYAYLNIICSFIIWLDGNSSNQIFLRKKLLLNNSFKSFSHQR